MEKNWLQMLYPGETLEDFALVKLEVEKGIRFSGTNLWILIIAILVASLGLNVNSTAVVIGAMLISPLMGPIIGMGWSACINDLELLKKAARNFLFATFVSLITSTLYFTFTPLDDAHSELLARTAPNIYDVLIAFFGGMAGIIAIGSKHKGNVLPGVAIATALMPPLCTAGYGIATGQWSFFWGAIYLFIINSVYIALATYVFVRIVGFPQVHLKNISDEKRANRIIIFLTAITLIPSIYLGYVMILNNQFIRKSNHFIQQEINERGLFIIRKTISPQNREITLYLAGQQSDSTLIAQLNEKLSNYNLEEVKLEVKQQNAFKNERKKGDFAQEDALNRKVLSLLSELDSLQKLEIHLKEIADELPILFPAISTVYYSNQKDTLSVLLLKKKGVTRADFDTLSIHKWLNREFSNKIVKLNISE
jgi:uncharacterized hydrophobic protein (TIGR00271 family)